ncbi:hypothetical protein ACQPYK_08525 [Streptosporangium sp. CA-135522]|uniref:hypothetical protein n=1 Tax=Streptosporangium sp. CA-135522 TaxID=3240072 RepID=UPI003D94C743
MAGIYKHGFPTNTDPELATEAALRAIRESGDNDPVLGEATRIETDAHREAGEYLVRIVTGQTDPGAS